jgi:hypothetical protein
MALTPSGQEPGKSAAKEYTGQAYYLTTDAVKLRYRGRLSINPSGTYHGSDMGSGLEGESSRSRKGYQSTRGAWKTT